MISIPSATFHFTKTDHKDRDFSIEQGATLNWFTFVVPGNYSQWIIRGQIRNNYSSRGGIIKTTFNFNPLIYGEITREDNTIIIGTVIKPYLTAQQTQSLDWLESKMIPRNSYLDIVIPGKNVWLYDIELENSQNEVIRLLEGYVEVKPGVTI